MVCDTMWCNLKFWEHEMEFCNSPVKVQDAVWLCYWKDFVADCWWLNFEIEFVNRWTISEAITIWIILSTLVIVLYFAVLCSSMGCWRYRGNLCKSNRTEDRLVVGMQWDCTGKFIESNLLLCCSNGNYLKLWGLLDWLREILLLLCDLPNDEVLNASWLMNFNRYEALNTSWLRNFT
jgi:hypothetical protein